MHNTPNPKCPSHPTVPWDVMNTLGNPKLSHAKHPKSQVSIPSHCTVGSNGHAGGIPSCPMHNTPNLKCPSHPTVPWEVMDTLWESQAVPCTTPQSQVSIPSHCTVGSNGHAGGIPSCPMHIPGVHPVSLIQGDHIITAPIQYNIGT